MALFKPLPQNEYAKIRGKRFKGESDDTLNMLPGDIDVPDVPDDGLSARERTDLLTTAVEYQMLRGIENEYRISAILGVPVASVKSAIPAVKRRWEYLGKNTKSGGELGKSVRKLEEYEVEAWALYEQAVTVPEKTHLLKLMSELTHRRLDRLGWTPQQVHLHLHAQAETQSDVPDGVDTTKIDEIANEFLIELKTLKGDDISEADYVVKN